MPIAPPSRDKAGKAARAASVSRDAVCIVGHGGFALALASTLTGRDLTALVYSDDDDVRREINRHHRSRWLPGVTLAKRVVVIEDAEEVARECRLFVLALSSRRVERALAQLSPYLDDHHIVAHAIGGLADGERRISQLIRAHTGVTRVVALAGPALPGDLVARRSSALVAAAEHADALVEIRRLLHHPPVLRIYTSRDLAGVELASALSGGLLVTVGMADGLGLGDGPRTVLVTRAVGELAALVAGSGGDLRTAYGMAGLGNLLARSSPASRKLSRDYQLGLSIGRGKRPVEPDTAGARAVATGCRLADLLGVQAPIFQATNDVLTGRLDVDQATEQLTAWEAAQE